MSNQRSTFILAGGGLLALSIVGISARQFALGPFAQAIAVWSPMVAYGTFGAAALLGTLLLVFAPSSRRVETRVRLDRPDRHNPVMARPAAAKAPSTAGIDPHGQKPVPRQSDAVRRAAAAPAAAPAATSAPGAAANGAATPPAQPPRRTVWAHPNDVADDRASEPHTAVPAPAAPPAQAEEDREALRARLAELDRQANHAKVRYGLGQLSGNGYRQVLAKLDEARAEIEETLLGSMET